MRIATGMLGHETNTFSKVPTTLESFEQGSYAVGEAIIPTFRGTSTVTGGFIDRAAELDVELVPLLWTFATPSGTIQQSAYDTLKERFLQRLTNAVPVDAVLLDLHGAMVTEAHEDAEGDLLEAVRDIVGTVPIVAVLDLHANITSKMAACADCLIGYDTYPHVDSYERGIEATQLIHDTVAGHVRPIMAHRQLPLLTGPPSQCTLREPMSGAIRQLHELENRPGILTATLSMGFPFADIRDAGACVLVTADGDGDLAAQAADEFAASIWERRAEFRSELVSIEEAIRLSRQTDSIPIVLAEGSDNPGGGGPCDGTHILRAFVEAEVDNAVIAIIADPQSVDQAIRAGVGQTVDLEVGGKTDPLHGEPVPLSCYVKMISTGTFVHTGPMGKGLTGKMGRTAVVVAGGVSIILTERRLQPYDDGLLRSLGIVPERCKLIALKSAVHFRAAYGPIAHRILEVDTPGVHSPNLFSYEYAKVRRPIYPLDEGVTFTP